MNLELPFGITDIAKLVETLNDRLRRIVEMLTRPYRAVGDIDAAGFRLRNLGDPQSGTDGMNVRTADRRYLSIAQANQVIDEHLRTSVVLRERTTGGAGGSQAIVLTVPGVLSIRSNAAPLVSLEEEREPKTIRAMVKQPPAGADLTATVYAADTQIGSVTIPAGSKVASTDLTGKTIPASALITLDITAVGSTYPGSDLTLMVSLS